MNTFGILALVALASITVVPVAKQAPPTLTTQFFSHPITLTLWSTTVTTIIPNICPLSSAFSATIEGLNFTEDLTGRDHGSTLVQFRGLSNSPTSYIISASDLSGLWLTEYFCTEQYPPPTPGGPSAASIQDMLNRVQATMLAASGSLRVLASGSYVLLDITPLASPTALVPYPVVANESWTVTTIS